MRKHSTDLWQELMSGVFNLIYTYEHLALTTMAERGDGHFMIRTVPEVTFTQYLLAFTPNGLILNTQFDMPAKADEMPSALHIPTGQSASPVEIRLPADLPDDVTTVPEPVAWDPRRLHPRESDIDGLYRLYLKG